MERSLQWLTVIGATLSILSAIFSLTEKSPCLLLIALTAGLLTGLGYVAFARKGTAFGTNVTVPRFARLFLWARIGLGVLLVVMIGSLLYEPTRLGLLAICVGTPTGTLTPTPTPTSTSAATTATTPTLAHTPTPTPTLALTATLPPTPACRFQAAADEETLRLLVLAEAEASNAGDLELITDIFAAEAMVVDGHALGNPIPALQHYADEFAQKDFRGIEHFDIFLTPRGLTPTAAWLTSGSRGEFSDNQGPWTLFDNGSTLHPKTPYGSDQWTFGRDAAGCWVIVEFRFNAGHVPFPP